MKSLVTVILIAAAGVCLAASAPYADTAGYGNIAALWHFDASITDAGNLYTPDDNSENPFRNSILGFYEGTVQVTTTGGPALVDPGAVVGYPAGNSAFGNAAYFDGVNDSFRIPNSKFTEYTNFNPSNVKVDFWVRPDNAQIDAGGVNKNYLLFDKWGQLIISLVGDATGAKWRFVVGQWDTNNLIKYLNSAWYLPADIKNWFDITYTNNYGVTNLYVNGTSVMSMTIATEALHAPTQITTFIGCRYNSLQLFSGYIDEMRISQAVPEEVSAPEFMSPYTDLIGYGMLLHMDANADANDLGYEGTVDDDSDNPDRDRDPIKYFGVNKVAKGATTGPQLVTPDDYPAGNPDFDKSFYFDGLGDSFRLSGDKNLYIDRLNFRIEAWVKIDQSQIIPSQGTAVTDYYIFDRRSQIRFIIADAGTAGWRLGYTLFATNAANNDYPAFYYGTTIDASPFEWHHVALEVYGSNIQLFVNDNLISNRTFKDNDILIAPHTENITYMGCSYGAGGSKYFCGWIDEMRVGPAVWSTPVCGGWGYSPADFNQDCSVDLLDFSEMFNEWLTTYEDSGASQAQSRALPLPGSYNVPQAVVTPAIDGAISAGEWDDAKPMEMIYPDLTLGGNTGTLTRLLTGGTPPTPADYSLFWYMKWDASGLYILGRVYDDIFAEPMGLDEPQFCFNLNNDLTATYLTEALVWNIPANGSINVNGGLVYTNSLIAGSVLSDGYVIEFKLAWSDLTSVNGGTAYVPQVNDVHGIGFTCQDHDAGNLRECVMNDYGSGAWVMNDLSTWNTITLVNTLSCGDLGYKMGDLNEDCVVGIADIKAVSTDWLACSEPFEDGCADFRM